MSVIQNSRSESRGGAGPQEYFFVGQKGFDWTLGFMATGTPGHMVIRGRIVLHGTPAVYIDSNEVVVDMTVTVIPPPIHTVVFNISDRVEVDSSEFTTTNSYTGQMIAEGNIIPLKFGVVPVNNGYAIQVLNFDLNVKWVVGARHIVIVDPSFSQAQLNAPYNGEAEQAASSATN